MRIAKSPTLSLTLAALLCGCALSHAAELEWEHDYERALARAASERKDLLIWFSSEDAGAAGKEKQALATEAFARFASQAFVPLLIPSRPADTDLAQRRKYGELRVALGVDALPAVAMTDAKGQPYAVVCFPQGAPSELPDRLAQFQSGKESLERMGNYIEKADADDRPGNLDATLTLLRNNGILFQHGELVKEIQKVAASGSGGLRDKWARFWQWECDRRTIAEAGELLRQSDLESAQAKLKPLLDGEKTPPLTRQKAFIKAAEISERAGEFEAALASLKKAQEALPHGICAQKDIPARIEALQKQKAQASK